MIRISGKNYTTISEAAKKFHVATKTVREWIAKGIIDKPPQVEYGVRLISHFPPSYLKRAKAQLDGYRIRKVAESQKNKRP